MIDYDLAEKLKDAGFYQGNPPDHVAEERHHSWVDKEGDYSNWQNNDDDCYVPALSELIEACGEKFMGMTRRPNGGFCAASIFDPVDCGEGSTPTEAVARLWLALHSKQA